MSKIKTLTDAQLKDRIKGAKLVIESSDGLIKEASKKKLIKLEEELKLREKETEKPTEKKSPKKDKPKKTTPKKDTSPESKFSIGDRVEFIDLPKEIKGKKNPLIGREGTILHIQRDDINVDIDGWGAEGFLPKNLKKVTSKTKEPSKKQSFELTVDGKVFKFSDSDAKAECERALNYAKAKKKKETENKEARKEGMEKAANTPVSHKISENFVSATKKAVAAISDTRIEKEPKVLRKEINAVEKAFNTLFDKLEALMGKEIGKEQRSQIMDVLTGFQSKLDEDDKKAKAEKKAKGGFAGSPNDNEWSYSKFLK